MKWTPQNLNMDVRPFFCLEILATCLTMPPELDCSCSQLQTNMTRTEVGQSRDTVHMQCILDNNIWNRNLAFKLISLMINFSVF